MLFVSTGLCRGLCWLALILAGPPSILLMSQVLAPPADPSSGVVTASAPAETKLLRTRLSPGGPESSC